MDGRSLHYVVRAEPNCVYEYKGAKLNRRVCEQKHHQRGSVHCLHNKYSKYALTKGIGFLLVALRFILVGPPAAVGARRAAGGSPNQ